MDRRQLASFVTLADDLHFSKAAARLNITQPALSHQIARLETVLGVRLFSRGPKHVALTDAGRVFLEEANETLRSMDRAVTMARRAQAGQIGRLSVAFVEAAPFNILPKLISAYSEAMPAVMVALQEMVTGEQVSAIGDGRVDVGLVRPLNLGRAITHTLIYSEPYIVALPRLHRLARLREIPLAALNGEHLITTPAGKRRYIESRFRARLEAAGVQLEIVQEVNQLHAMIGLVGAALGVAFVPTSVARLRLDGVVYRPLAAADTPNAELAIAWRAGNSSRTLERFIAVARQFAAAR